MIAKRVVMSVVAVLGLTGLVVGCQREEGRPRSWTMLHRAVFEESVVDVKRCLADGDDVHTRDEHGWTPLCWAAKLGNLEIAEMLIAGGADANDGSLAQAVGAKRRPMAELLLSKGARPGGDPLVQAAMDGNVELASLLICKGADVNAKGVDVINGRPGIDDCGKKDYGETPLYVACERGRLEVVKLLLEHNANVNLKSRYGSPIQAAAEMGHEEIVKLLLARGAKVEAKGNARQPATSERK